MKFEKNMFYRIGGGKLPKIMRNKKPLTLEEFQKLPLKEKEKWRIIAK